MRLIASRRVCVNVFVQTAACARARGGVLAVIAVFALFLFEGAAAILPPLCGCGFCSGVLPRSVYLRCQASFQILVGAVTSTGCRDGCRDCVASPRIFPCRVVLRLRAFFHAPLRRVCSCVRECVGCMFWVLLSNEWVVSLR